MSIDIDVYFTQYTLSMGKTWCDIANITSIVHTCERCDLAHFVTMSMGGRQVRTLASLSVVGEA